jgi:hypothetical protein
MIPAMKPMKEQKENFCQAFARTNKKAARRRPFR